jgi:hypothetical protein
LISVGGGSSNVWIFRQSEEQEEEAGRFLC